MWRRGRSGLQVCDEAGFLDDSTNLAMAFTGHKITIEVER